MNFLFKKVHAGRDLFALLGELNQGPGDRPPKLKKGAGTVFASLSSLFVYGSWAGSGEDLIRLNSKTPPLDLTLPNSNISPQGV